MAYDEFANDEEKTMFFLQEIQKHGSISCIEILLFCQSLVKIFFAILSHFYLNDYSFGTVFVRKEVDFKFRTKECKLLFSL